MKPIAIDLDAVVVDLVAAMLPKLSELAERPVMHEDIHVFDIAQALGLTDAAMAELWGWLERQRAYARAPAIEGAVEAVRYLGHGKAWLVTSRSESLRAQTLQWLKSHGLGNHRLLMDLPPEKPLEPGRFCALIEDNPTCLDSVASRVELVLLYDQPWNRHVPARANIVRVHGWGEVMGLLKERFR